MKITSRVAWAGVAGEGEVGQRQVAARTRLPDTPARPLARGAIPAAPHVAPAACGTASTGHYDIACITTESSAPHWTGEWRRLLAASRSPEKIYQTPEFFRFMVDTHTSTSDQFALFVVKQDDQVVGMVPVRISGVPLAAKLAALSLLRWQPRVVRILGSVPMLPDDPALTQQLFAHLLETFPDCAAVSMQAFPRELAAHLQGSRHAAALLHGWRDCHTIPLPAAWPAYLAKMSAKKRYNLTRQYRLLEQAAGPLTLHRIDRSVNVRELIAGMDALSAGGASLAGGVARDYRVLAANRLLLSYVLKSAEEVVAVVTGSRYGDTWHVHHVRYAPRYRSLSAGSVALHAALEDVVSQFAFTVADIGFGKPRYRFASTHVLQARAHVLITRKRSVAALAIAAFVRYDRLHDAGVQCVRALARWRGRKAAD